MTVTINGSGTIGGIVAGGLPDGVVQPADLTTGAPSWDSSGNLSFNSGYGSVATAYGCRAWVNFNGSTSAMRAYGNVSSVTRGGAGNYTVNLASAMPDANYAYAIEIQNDASDYAGYAPSVLQWPSHTKTTTAFQFYTIIASLPSSGQKDYPAIHVSFFR